MFHFHKYLLHIKFHVYVYGNHSRQHPKNGQILSFLNSTAAIVSKHTQKNAQQNSGITIPFPLKIV